MNQQKELQESEQIDGISVGMANDNILIWDIGFGMPSDNDCGIYEGAYFKAQMRFPSTYPNNPPQFFFMTEMWHPNIYKTGEVCISILTSVNDPNQFDDFVPDSAKWRPILTPEDVLVSIISMLYEPNLSSPANVDASIQMRDFPQEYYKKVRKTVDKGIQDL